MELNDKVSIVTGGAVRIGRAIALRLAEEGAKICLHYGSSQRQAEDVLETINSKGGAATAVQADLSQPLEASRQIIEHALQQFGRLDILVNSAAIFQRGTLSTTTEAIWNRHFDINLKAPFFLTQSFAAQLRSDQQAHVVNIADWRVSRPGPDYAAYTLTKSALITLTRYLAVELAPQVQVNAIAPGAILPPPGVSEAHFQKLTQQIPLQRTGSPEDIAGTLLFLLQSDFITGEVIQVTGGEHL